MKTKNLYKTVAELFVYALLWMVMIVSFLNLAL
jgi:hypothetical protein